MIPPYLNLTDLDGRPVTIFLQGIVMIAPGSNHDGAYIQLTIGGISTQESYEEVRARLRAAAEPREVAQRELGAWSSHWHRPGEKK
jgi:hypothetical protein